MVGQIADSGAKDASQDAGDGISSLLAGLSAMPLTVHPWPGGGTWQSPNYLVDVDGQASFVWYTSAANRQPLAPGGGYEPITSPNKDTSYTMFDMSLPLAPAHISVSLLNGKAQSAAVFPSSAGIVPEIAPDGTMVTFVITEPRQVCLVIDGIADKPLCVFADPAQIDPPSGPADGVIFFGPGVHYPGLINVTSNQTVYVAGGAHVYGQVVVADPNAPCVGVKVIGRGVLDGHNLPIDYRAFAMLQLPQCTDFVVEGITTVDSPQYQIFSWAPRNIIRWAKAIAWGYTTDGWSSGAYSTVEHCFFKVNDDSSKLFDTGVLVQHNVYWQMENGCPLMMSWNTATNVGFITARDNDVIAHEKASDSAVDGVICAAHGGHGNLNNYLFDGLRIENAQWALVSVELLPNEWAQSGPSLGNISTVFLRNVSAAMPFGASAKSTYELLGNSTKSWIDSFVYDNVVIAGKPISYEDVMPGIGPFVANVTVCTGCVAEMFPSLQGGATEWSRAERCGRATQPFVDGTSLPPLTPVYPAPSWCEELPVANQPPTVVDSAMPQRLTGELKAKLEHLWHKYKHGRQ
eukprot:TRINITY_DN42917_c0_g1_i1.p1 TRINITY_DN42917_c0_g1~~TRINITY_DN42917_c0_g1_i1.p1  ORF type:complete len:650 (-),score=88.11 TRINITY_DN42917_c0_g1_i1:20-1744(-)